MDMFSIFAALLFHTKGNTALIFYIDSFLLLRNLQKKLSFNLSRAGDFYSLIQLLVILSYFKKHISNPAYPQQCYGFLKSTVTIISLCDRLFSIATYISIHIIYNKSFIIAFILTFINQ